jgi:hypothetical protein
MVEVNRKNILNYKGFPINLDNIAEDMTSGCLKELKEIFFLEGRYSPIVRWCSTLQNEWPNVHKSLFSAWRGGDLSNCTNANVAKQSLFAPIRGSLVVAEHVAAKADFNFLHVGADVRESGSVFREGNSLLRSVEFDSSASSLFLATCYVAAVLREQPLLAICQLGNNGKLSVRSSLIAPAQVVNSTLIVSSLSSMG